MSSSRSAAAFDDASSRRAFHSSTYGVRRALGVRSRYPPGDGGGEHLVGELDLDRVLGAGLEQPALPLVRDRRLLGGEEACPELNALGAEAERGRETPSVGDPACRDDGHRRDCVDDLRQERECADLPAEATRLAALGDDHVHADLGGFPCLGDRVHLLDEACARLVRAGHELARVADREPERPLDDRVLDPEEIAHSGAEHRPVPYAGAALGLRG
jgi:hypothetical protein